MGGWGDGKKEERRVRDSGTKMMQNEKESNGSNYKSVRQQISEILTFKVSVNYENFRIGGARMAELKFRYP